VSSSGARDRALVDAVLAGDRDAYRTLVERESRAVIGLCQQVLRDPDEAQDVAQDAFVQAFRSLAGYRGDGSFGAWIGRIARRMAVARAITSGRRVAASAASAADLGGDEGADPLRHIVAGEHSARLRRAVEGLPADQRQVVALRFFTARWRGCASRAI
jgi:RNA polymerase sigma-70 factor (ECF subfamily)